MKVEIHQKGASLHISTGTARISITRREWNRYTTPREMNKKPRLYVGVESETLLENLQNRTRRPNGVYREMVKAEFANLDWFGIHLNLDEMRWSQKAGCSMCPCSPGFILGDGAFRFENFTAYHYDIWVTMVDAPAVDESKPARNIGILL